MSKLIPQFITVAIEEPLSCIISAIYNQVIGPGPNSKIQMKTNTPAIRTTGKLLKKAYPTTILIIARSKLVTNIICFLPALASNSIPPNVARKFTIPTSPVMVVAEMLGLAI